MTMGEGVFSGLGTVAEGKLGEESYVHNVVLMPGSKSPCILLLIEGEKRSLTRGS